MKLPIFGLACGSILVSFSYGQATLYSIEGSSMGAKLGSTVSNAGDANGDGFTDIIVGAPGAEVAGVVVGQATLISGQNGAILHQFDGPAAGDSFGSKVAGAGDVNGDGFADVMVSSAGFMGATGRVTVFNGRNGTILYTFDGRAPNDFFGVSIDGVGDVNNDGRDDVAVGAIGFDPVGPDLGMVEVYSGIDGSVLLTINGAADDTLGAAVSEVGDVNNDNHADFVIGAPSLFLPSPTGGEARLVSGMDGSTLFSWTAPPLFTSSNMGSAVAGAGDVNMDGTPDVIVGNWSASGPGIPDRIGEVSVWSGLDGTLLYRFLGRHEDDQFGWSVAGAGDVDGDGFADLIAGAPYSGGSVLEKGEARIFSGANGQELYTLQGENFGSFFGYSVDGALDVNQDGFADYVVGSNIHSGMFFEGGQATVHTGNMANLNGFTYCISNANSLGLVAGIGAIGSRKATDNNLTLQVTDVPNSQFAFFVAGRGQDQVNNPGGSQGNLCIGGGSPIVRFNTSIGQIAANQYHATLDLSSFPEPPTFAVQVMAGETWHFQAWYRDNGGADNFSAALGVVFN